MIAGVSRKLIHAGQALTAGVNAQFSPVILLPGHLWSILRIISTAKSMLSRNAISRAGDGLPSSAADFLHAKIAAMTPRVRFRPF
jgi:hypothetical protein